MVVYIQKKIKNVWRTVLTTDSVLAKKNLDYFRKQYCQYRFRVSIEKTDDVPVKLNEKILPCPFCNNNDIRFNCHKLHTSPTGELWSMCCYNCGATFPNRYKKELLLMAWNTRSFVKHVKL